jgi:16S rRNA (uracil1498-N3)-methyltransferase
MNNLSSSDRHIFALHVSHALSLIDVRHIGQQCAVRDAEVWHRVAHILHAREDDKFVFFDTEKIIEMKLTSLAKKNTVEGILLSLKQPEPLKPAINLFQGILKREAWSDSAYYAAQMGVTRIIPLITAKVHREWGGERESERMRNVMIAACEQAHQFVIPDIMQPVVLDEKTFDNKQKPLLYAEPGGTHFFGCLSSLVTQRPQELSVVIGPEGGLTVEECRFLDQSGAQRVALTPTILRAHDAVAVCIGALRSALSEM